MRVIDPLLGIKELMRITGYSRVTIYRKVSATRAGKEQFVLPITGYKQKMRWSAADVEAYCRGRDTQQPPVAAFNSKKQSDECRKRREATNQVLARHGIVISNSTKRGE